MPNSSQTGPLLAYTHPLPRGPRVHLRLARPRDAAGVRELLQRQGYEAQELEIERLLRFDPRERCVICATALVQAHEAIVGIGAIEAGQAAEGKPNEPILVVADEELTEGLAELLRWALLSRARVSVRDRAA